jgi:hypothetical protein
MRDITKVSEITANDVAEYLRLPDPEVGDINFINSLILISKAFICSYTGVANDKLDNYSDFIIVVFIFCQDMWDNRTLYVDSSNLSYPAQTILGMHSVNLL